MMMNTRTRLTTFYAVTLAGTVAVLLIALAFARGPAEDQLRRAQAEAARRAAQRAAAQADSVARLLDNFTAFGVRAAVPADSAGTRAKLNTTVAIEMQKYDGYIVLIAADGAALYASPNIPDSPEGRRFVSASTELSDTMPTAVLPLLEQSVSVVSRSTRVRDAVPATDSTGVRDSTSAKNRDVSRVTVGVALDNASGTSGVYGLALLIIVPLVIAGSIAVAHRMSAGVLHPIEQIINEVEAITDGRSLHRRLPVEDTGDELARLSVTLNAMISRLQLSFGGLRRFTGDASHELKTPLAVLRADVERAMQAGTGSTDQLIALEEALQEITRMADLVDSLLTLARADEGRFDLHREPVELKPLLADVFETALILGEQAELEVRLHLVENAIVMGDPPRMRELFLNLITNAIKYTPRGGRVDLTADLRDDGVAFSVQDTGIGISAADLPHVFERFWRADQARSRVPERGGNGLGLAISQWIAQAHGGTLTAVSRLGRGSTFTVWLPLPDAAEPDGPAVGHDAVPLADAEGAR
jgi:signal transduction histidine kinase